MRTRLVLLLFLTIAQVFADNGYCYDIQDCTTCGNDPNCKWCGTKPPTRSVEADAPAGCNPVDTIDFCNAESYYSDTANCDVLGCYGAKTCEECGAKPGCVFCKDWVPGGSYQCVDDTSLNLCDNDTPKYSDPNQCPTCSEIQTCDECTANDDCKWCIEDEPAGKRSTSSLDSSCKDADTMDVCFGNFEKTGCPKQDCRFIAGCAECAKAGCTFCKEWVPGGTFICVDDDDVNTQCQNPGPIKYTTESECDAFDPCWNHADCDKCQMDDSCKWCGPAPETKRNTNAMTAKPNQCNSKDKDGCYFEDELKQNCNYIEDQVANSCELQNSCDTCMEKTGCYWCRDWASPTPSYACHSSDTTCDIFEPIFHTSDDDSCLQPIKVLGFEVTQGLQNLDQTEEIELVTGRKTFVRVYVGKDSGETHPTKPRARLLLDGGNSDIVEMESSIIPSILSRSDTDRTLNFILPSSTVSSVGEFDIGFELTSSHKLWCNPKYPCTSKGRIDREGVAPKLVVHRLDYHGPCVEPSGCGAPSTDKTWEVISEIEAMIPVKNLDDVQIETHDIGNLILTNVGLTIENSITLSEYMDYLKGTGEGIFFGFISLPVFSDWGGLRGAAISGSDSFWSTDTDWTPEHEFLHAVSGSKHIGGCGDPENVDDSYPYGVEIAEETDDPQTEIWGIQNIDEWKLRSPSTRNVMTYCNSNTQWISKFEYAQTLQALNSHAKKRGVIRLKTTSLRILGTLSDDNKVTISLMVKRPDTLAPSDASNLRYGPIIIRFLDDQGNEVDTFLPVVSDYANVKSVRSFSLNTLWKSTYNQIQIVDRNDNILYSATAPAKEPVVSILSPLENTKLPESGSLNVTWKSGDDLTYIVEYRASPTDSWRTYGMTKSSPLVLRVESLRSAEGTASIRVGATDGWHTTWSSVDGLTMPKRKIELSIRSKTATEDGTTLRAIAYDFNTGSIVTDIKWKSEGKVVGTGTSVTLGTVYNGKTLVVEAGEDSTLVSKEVNLEDNPTVPNNTTTTPPSSFATRVELVVGLMLSFVYLTLFGL